VSGARRRPGRGPLDGARARAVALSLLAQRPWTRRDLARRLRRRGAPADVAEAVVADLEARGYVDDRAFAVTWVEVRGRERGFGRERLRQELLQRGIAKPIVDAAIAGAFVEVDELARAHAVAARRLGPWRRRMPEQAARRLQAYLRRRGYPEDIVRQVVRTVGRGSLPDEATEP
jgi:regulatory protein